MHGKTLEVNDKRTNENGMTVDIEARVRKIGHLRLAAMEFDDGCSLDRPDIAPGAAFIQPQQRRQARQRRDVDVERIAGQFSDACLLKCRFQAFTHSNRKQQSVCLSTRGLI